MESAARGWGGWSWAEGLALLSCIALAQLPQPASDPNALGWLLASLAPLWAAIAWAARRRRQGLLARIAAAVRGYPWLGLTFAAFIVVQLLAFYRGGKAGATPLGPPLYVETILALGLVFLFGRWDPSREERVPGLLLTGLWLYVAVNVVAHMVGVHSPGVIYVPGEYPGSHLFRLVGLGVSVVLFPLASGVNAFGGVVGAAWASSWIFVRHRLSGIARAATLIGVSLFCLVILFLVDSRGPSCSRY